ncbi:vacuolar amino acid permease [Pseudohyphozyma bogoriensis]|nr:vacuolar amino acid permease [Pseudohyphozyma bogoriensis]
MSERTPLLTPENKPAPPSAELSPGESLSTRQKVMILAGTQGAVFLGALDMTITATLLTPIASSFHASHQSSWLGTAFLLSNIAFTPLYGRLCNILGRRIANASAIALFTAGTIGCAVAPSMKWLIFARFVAGAGGGGISTTSSVVMSDLFSLKQRGLVGAVGTMIWAVGGALGGPVGGIVTDLFGWRAAFIFQIPLLTLALLSGLTTINYAVPSFVTNQTARQKLARIDFLGCGCLLFGFGSLLTALSLKNNQRASWSNPWLIFTTTLAPLFLALFIFVEAKVSPEPVLPFKIIARRTPLFVCLVTVFVAVCNFGVMYHYPIFFLALTSSTAGQAGSHLLPSSIGQVLGGLIAGTVLHRTGKYYWPSAVAGITAPAAVFTIASLTPSSPAWLQWGSILPMGFGFGYILNSSFVALMASVPRDQVPQVTGVMWLFRTTGQVVGVASTSAILQGVLTPSLISRITGKNADKWIKIIREDASIIPTLKPSLQEAAKGSYTVALRWTFLFCSAFALFAWLSILFIEELELEGKGPSREAQAEVRAADQRFPAEGDAPAESGFTIRSSSQV